ncbi:hypothetical protein FACS189485_07970 [Spirochaetia bacterium]|nr:hypothetical protein FACS189485_07970 [Spirochaetia bacterium]
MEKVEIFTERLKTARETRKLTQAELGIKAGLPPSSIAHFENGSRKPSFDTLRRLASALDMTTDFLLGRVEDPTMAPDGDILYRNMQKLSSTDRELAADFLKMLADRNIKNDKSI